MTEPTAMVATPPALTLHGRSLTARLVALVVLLLAAMGVVIAATSLIAAKHYLDNQLSGQLARAAVRGTPPPGTATDGDDRSGIGQGPRGATHNDLMFLGGGGTPEGTFGAVVSNGSVTSAGEVWPDNTQHTQAYRELPVADYLSLASASITDGATHDVELAGLGDYRVKATAHDGKLVIVGLPLGGMHQVLAQVSATIAIVGVAGLLLAAVTGTVMVRRSLQPLRRLVGAATRVAELPLDRRDVALAVRVPEQDTDPRTEVGQLGAALNRMLGHVGDALAARTASEARMRRFVADASHELRTPLASIRGYAELTRRSGAELTPDVGHAIGRVESEAVRMTGLVEDLLLLARLDESADAAALKHEDVDLSAIAIDCVGDAHVLGPNHVWRLDLPDEPVVVTGDRARLHQVLTNLLTNARVHTPAGTKVVVRLAGDDDGQVLLEVADDGPGIPEALQGAVFDRFARGDSSRSRAAGSTGLGLAIVASVVAAHHGHVEVSSRPGATTFSVWLPATAETH